MLSSTAETAELWGFLLGEYKEEGTSGGKPYYKQRDNVGKIDWFLFYSGSCLDHGWRVGPVLGACSHKFLRNPADTDSPPAELGWQFHSNGNWIDDSSLGLEFGSLEPCSGVDVAAQGEAAVVRKAELGTYLPTGDWLQGHPIYSKTEGETRYLRMAEQANGWRVADARLGINSFLKNQRGTLSPGDADAQPNVWFGLSKEGWRYWNDESDGKKWQRSRGQVTVTCNPNTDGP